MKELFEKILAHPIATGIVVTATAAGIAAVIKAVNKSN